MTSLFVHRSSLQSNMNKTPEETEEAAKMISPTDHPHPVDVPEATFWCTLFILEAILIVIGNLLTTVVFLRSRRLRKRRYYLIINLAISDTLVGALAMPLFLVPFGKSLKVWGTVSAVPGDAGLFFDMFSGFASITFLTLISLERLYATLRPFNYRALESRWYVLLTVIAWITAGFIPSMHLIALNYPGMLHSPQKNTMVSLWVPFLSAQLLLICISYMVIWRKVTVIHKSVGKERAVDKESSLSRICFLVTAMSVIAWLPFVIVSMVINTTFELFNFHAFYITKFLHYGNSLLNPVLYVLKIPEFKASLSQLFNRNAGDPTTGDLSATLSPRSLKSRFR